MKKANVFLWIPNLIGYLRVILSILSIYYMKTSIYHCLLCYTTSCVLDVFDGYAARYFKQSSQFGAVLDMVTDRCTSTSLLCYLSSVYDDYFLFFQLIIALDISSHYMHMVSSLMHGAKSHKIIMEKQHPILKAYYHNRIVLFSMCAGNELFFISSYMVSKENQYANAGYLILYVSFPIFVAKNSINLVQLISAAQSLAKLDRKEHKSE